MSQATIRFHAELNDFLAAEQRRAAIRYPLLGSVAVKHAVEALGVPHAEVEAILVNDRPVSFSYQLQAKDRVRVFPASAGPGDRPELILRPPMPSPPCFVIDNHLGQLATYLRLLGFDALYPNDSNDEKLAQIAHDEDRVLLTRDRRLLMRKLVVYGYFLRSKDPREQIEAILHRFQLFDSLRPWRRCLRCNGRLRPVPKEEVLDRLEPKTKLYYHEFHICRECQQIYWKGSHYEPLRQFVEAIQQQDPAK